MHAPQREAYFIQHAICWEKLCSDVITSKFPPLFCWHSGTFRLFYCWATSLLHQQYLRATCGEHIIRYITPLVKVDRFYRHRIRGTWMRFAVQSGQTSYAELSDTEGAVIVLARHDVPVSQKETPAWAFHASDEPQPRSRQHVWEQKQIINGRNRRKLAGTEQVTKTRKQRHTAAFSGKKQKDAGDEHDAENVPVFYFYSPIQQLCHFPLQRWHFWSLKINLFFHICLHRWECGLAYLPSKNVPPLQLKCWL